jgi:predicted small secreted protein
MFKPAFTCTALLAATLAVGACSKTRGVGEDEYQDYRTKGPERGRMFGDSSITLGANKSGGSGGSGGSEEGAALGVNAYLWRGALDTLGFMPLASADPFGGVIITDWYSPPAAQGERFKATAYILGRQLRTDGIKINVFRQVLQNGQWMDASVSAATTGEIEDKVLARARELRSQTASN